MNHILKPLLYTTLIYGLKEQILAMESKLLDVMNSLAHQIKFLPIFMHYKLAILIIKLCYRERT